MAQDKSPESSGGGVNTVIPYKNPKALIAYYLGIFSIIPCLGGILGLFALILGIMGLAYGKKNPEAKGSVHAWIGVIVGGLSFLAHLILAVVIISN